MLSKSKTALKREQVLTWFGGREAYQQQHDEHATDFKTIAPFLEQDEL